MIEDNLWRKTTIEGWQHSMEDDHHWKMTFDGGWPSMEDILQWKRLFDGKWPSMKDDLWNKTIFDWREPLMEDILWWKLTFDGSRLLMEADLWWKLTFDGRWSLMEWNTTLVGRWPSMKDDLWSKTSFYAIQPWEEEKRRSELEFNTKNNMSCLYQIWLNWPQILYIWIVRRIWRISFEHLLSSMRGDNVTTGSFDKSIIFHTPIKSCQKYSLRLIFA